MLIIQLNFGLPRNGPLKLPRHYAIFKENLNNIKNFQSNNLTRKYHKTQNFINNSKIK